MEIALGAKLSLFVCNSLLAVWLVHHLLILAKRVARQVKESLSCPEEVISI